MNLSALDWERKQQERKNFCIFEKQVGRKEIFVQSDKLQILNEAKERDAQRIQKMKQMNESMREAERKF